MCSTHATKMTRGMFNFSDRWYCEDGTERVNLVDGENSWDPKVDSGHFKEDICEHCKVHRKDHKFVPGK